MRRAKGCVIPALVVGAVVFALPVAILSAGITPTLGYFTRKSRRNSARLSRMMTNNGRGRFELE